MSERRVGRPTWPARLGAIAGLVAFCAAPVVVYLLAGRFPSFPRLTTWAAFRNFLSQLDEEKGAVHDVQQWRSSPMSAELDQAIDQQRQLLTQVLGKFVKDRLSSA